MTLLLPDRGQPLPRDDTLEAEGVEPRFLGDVVMQAQAEVMAVLTRISLPFDELQKLQPGQILPIGAAALQTAALEAGQGQRVADVALGHINGFRAVRLSGKCRTQANEPEMEALPDPSLLVATIEGNLQNSGNDTVENIEIPSDEELLAGMPGVPDMAGETGPTAADLMSDMGLDDADLSELEDLSDLEDFPDLADLPDPEVQRPAGVPDS